MPSGAQSIYFFITLLGGVFVPLLFFVAVKRAVDCAFAYLEALVDWEGAAGASEVRPPQVVHGGAASSCRQQSNVLVDGIILTGTESGLVGAVNGCTDPCEPAAPNGEPRETRLHKCIAKCEPLRDAPRRGANHLGAVAVEGDTFRVLDRIIDSGGVDRMFVRLESSGKVGWVRSSTAVPEVAMHTTRETVQVQAAVASFAVAPAATAVEHRPQEPLARPILGSQGDPSADAAADSAAVAVERWLAGRGLAQRDIVSGACAALDKAGVPPRDWRSEMEALEIEGSLQHWLGLIKAQGARTATSNTAACAAEDV